MTDTALRTLWNARAVLGDMVGEQGFADHVHRGTATAGGPAMSIRFVGRTRFSADCRMLLHEDAHQVAPFSRQGTMGTLGWLAHRRRRQEDLGGADLLVEDTFMQSPQRQGLPVFSPHVDAVLPLAGTMEEQLLRVPSTGLRKRMRAVARQGVHWRITQATEDLQRFYRDMYLPTVRSRFGPEGCTSSWDEVLSMFRPHGSLLLALHSDGRPAGGALLYTSSLRPGTLYFWKTGLAGIAGQTAAERSDANARVESAVLMHALAEGHSALHLGVTRGLPEDGVFVHKQRLGCLFVPNPSYLDAHLHGAAALMAQVLSARPLLMWRDALPVVWLGQDGELTEEGATRLAERLRLGAGLQVNTRRLFVRGVASTMEALVATVRAAEEDTGGTVEVIQT